MKGFDKDEKTNIGTVVFSVIFVIGQNPVIDGEKSRNVFVGHGKKMNAHTLDGAFQAKRKAGICNSLKMMIFPRLILKLRTMWQRPSKILKLRTMWQRPSKILQVSLQLLF